MFTIVGTPVDERRTRYLQSQPASRYSVTMSSFNETLQSCVVDLLQALISRGEVDSHTLQIAESVVVGKLYLCVHSGRLDLQNKMLQADLADKNRYIATLEKRLLQARRTSHSRVSMQLASRVSQSEGSGYELLIRGA